MSLNFLLSIDIGEILKGLWNSSGIANGNPLNYVMLLVSFVLMYLAIVKKFEPLLLLPIAFGMFLINLPGAYDILWGKYLTEEAHGYYDVIPETRGLLCYRPNHDF